ncbi:helix-turn-helix transcriptional regulator [Pelagicoccus sp. SDUM812005]|uniref:helix-turn-helix transcriptional regulator n=1 Tax=Pelagicoccus sp. SDUM812005 TaxID=3041257 RepID=UPI00280E7F62|nr:helix-turn-helix transcriptional regulator [Pelagicoccus sp. SDUM812005]MDQ8179122.1 helix-turn-helix transcriptional regulator [Pelagicoccus sp. SDUM812005]
MIEERNERPESEDLQLSYVCQLLASLTRNPFDEEPSDEALRSRARVEAYVERLASSFWKTEDLDSVARSLGLSRRRFTQIFREVTGESWLARVTRLRMEHARHLLTETQLSVRSICFECGFAEISSFYRLFRSTYRTSPGAFRKQAGERR